MFHKYIIYFLIFFIVKIYLWPDEMVLWTG